MIGRRDEWMDAAVLLLVTSQYVLKGCQGHVVFSLLYVLQGQSIPGIDVVLVMSFFFLSQWGVVVVVGCGWIRMRFCIIIIIKASINTRFRDRRRRLMANVCRGWSNLSCSWCILGRWMISTGIGIISSGSGSGGGSPWI